MRRKILATLKSWMHCSRKPRCFHVSEIRQQPLLHSTHVPKSLNRSIKKFKSSCIRFESVCSFPISPWCKKKIEKAKLLVDQGGDWDRRNRLKVYEGVYLLMARDFKKAATLFQESVPTFTAEELLSFQTLTFYCIVSSVLTVSRMELRQHIVDSPEIRAAVQEHLVPFINGLYDCQYKTFFTAIIELQPYLLRDPYLATHVRYIYRELRALAYAQFLEAYRSVMMESMARSFGIGVKFLDSELSRFISSGRLNAKIDKVAGIIETNRPDMKNMKYQQMIKKGDFLLNRIQKLARVTNV